MVCTHWMLIVRAPAGMHLLLIAPLPDEELTIQEGSMLQIHTSIRSCGHIIIHTLEYLQVLQLRVELNACMKTTHVSGMES